jgi:amino acid adenylation domain-containing protein
VTLNRLFEARAQRTPEALAVQAHDGQLTYGSLDARANRLAHHLRAVGVCRGDVVAIALPRSTWTIAAILATMKAGAAYLPVDPAYPMKRAELMIRDAGASCVVTSRAIAAQLPDTPLVTVDEADAPIFAGQPATAPAVAVDDQDMAYVIYTSGSTGTPKAAAIEHRGAVSAIRAQDAVNPEPPRRFLVVFSLSFDGSIVGIFWTLARGGLVLLPADDAAGDPGQIAALLERERATHFMCVPSLLRAVQREIPKRDLAQLRRVIVCGEACGVDVVERHQHLLPGAGLTNEYGPTEASIWATGWTAPRDEPVREPVPIGRAVGAAEVHLVASDGVVLRDEGSGELYIGGLGVGRGYLGRPALTAQRFVPDWISGRAGARLYRTGDLARRRTDGTLEYLGRADDQLKLRGFRIEPGEVEAVLLRRLDVCQAIVVVREDRPGDQRLVAFLTGTRQPDALVRDAAGDELPPHMVPSHVVWLDDLPRAQAGKVDRRALTIDARFSPPGRSTTPWNRAADRALQGSLVEQEIAAIWSEVLDVPHIDRDVNFFDLGGHSLLLAHIHGELRDRLGVDTPLVSLFRHPTVRTLAAHLAAAPEFVSRAEDGAGK